MSETVTEEEQTQTLHKENQIFADMPIHKAVAAMAVPTIISQLITVIYNLADTWYVGLTENAAAVAAISLCLPVYNMMAGFSNLFGVGGASVIARALGSGKKERAQTAFKVSVLASLTAAILYSLLLIPFSRPLLLRIGGDAGSIDYAVIYTWITIIIGGIPTILASTLAHVIRSTGQSRISSIGITFGAVLNMVLDPLFMFVLLPRGNEVMGAALATTISNAVSVVFFLLWLARHKENEVLRFRAVRTHTVSNQKSAADTKSVPVSNAVQHPGRVLGNIMKCGITSFCLVGAAMFSNCFLNGMLAEMGSSSAVAGIGITRKLDSVAYAVNQGITQGMLPIVSYCYASGRIGRMKKVVGFSAACTMSFSVIWCLISWFFAPELISIFIRDADTIFYGAKFLRVLCISVAIYPLNFVIITVFQAVGDSIKPFFLSLLHKGSVDIVLYFVIRAIWGLDYILWASPVMDAIAVVTAVVLYRQRFFRKKHF